MEPEQAAETATEPPTDKPKEFTGKNLGIAFLRDMLFTVAVIFMLLSLIPLYGLIFGSAAICIFVWSIFMSLKDRSGFKWANIVLKALFAFFALLLMALNVFVMLRR